jgi:hypothetical protein
VLWAKAGCESASARSTGASKSVRISPILSLMCVPLAPLNSMPLSRFLLQLPRHCRKSKKIDDYQGARGDMGRS